MRWQFLIKTDHDAFVRLDTVTAELAQLPEEDRHARAAYWHGFVYNGIPPVRDLSDKNADHGVPIMTFPTYTAGTR
jgi:hypothetical protein